MSLTIPDPAITTLRNFNRLYTHRLGLLNAHLDQSPFTLSEARVLYELAHRPTPTAADIGRALDLDRAQLSRTLKRFAGRALIDSVAHPAGGRRRAISLTAKGRAAFTALDRNTNHAIGALLAALSPGDRTRLLSAATTITQVLGDGERPPVRLRDLAPGDIGWITHRQAVLYAAEYGWDNTYEALVARILADFVQAFDPAHESAWIAEIGGRVVGSVFLARGDAPGVGKLRLLYVEPDLRGRGVGAMLVDACVARARAAGYRTLTLWTNSVLLAARRIYQRAGFTKTAETSHRSFGHDLIGETWALDLDVPGDAAEAAAPEP